MSLKFHLLATLYMRMYTWMVGHGILKLLSDILATMLLMYIFKFSQPPIRSNVGFNKSLWCWQ